MEIFQDLRKRNQGVILLTSHFGNWEVMSWCAQFDLQVSGLYQRLSFSTSRSTIHATSSSSRHEVDREKIRDP